MRLKRLRSMYVTHGGRRLHRYILTVPAFELNGQRALLVQQEPRGLWRLSPWASDIEAERAYDEIYGPMSLRAALARLRLGV